MIVHSLKLKPCGFQAVPPHVYGHQRNHLEEELLDKYIKPLSCLMYVDDVLFLASGQVAEIFVVNTTLTSLINICLTEFSHTSIYVLNTRITREAREQRHAKGFKTTESLPT